MIRIAVVGDIGSGKSYVAKSFGYPVFDADDEVRKLYFKNNICFNKLNKLFPFHTPNSIISPFIFFVFFNNSKHTKNLNKLLSPIKDPKF